MPFVKIRVRMLLDGSEHSEEIEVSSLKTAKKEANQILREFNLTERERRGTSSQFRKLIRVEGEVEPKFRPHKWEKMNLVTKEDKDGMYDLWECTVCGKKYKRRGFEEPPHSNCPGKRM